MRAKRTVRATVLAIGVAFGGLQSRAEEVALQVSVTVNSQDTGRVASIVQRGKALYSAPSELDELGVAVPPGLHPDAAGLVPLSSIPGLDARLNERTQVLQLSAAPSALKTTVINGDRPEPALPASSSTGAVLNYDLLGTTTGRDTIATGFFEARAFSEWGVLSSSAIANSSGSFGQDRLLRLDTTWSYADPDTLQRWTAGDLISGGLGWSRPVRLGGVQLSTEFSLRPDLITFAVPTVTGQASLPSTADVLVDGVRRLSAPVAAGPFELTQPPIVSGAGTISLVVRDAMGRESVSDLPFYVSPDVLRPGLASYSIEAGAVRRDYGGRSDDYGAPAASASFRYGESDWLTLEAHGEATGRLAMAGAGAAARIGYLGVVTAAVAASTGRTGGALATVGFERQDSIFSVGFSATRTTSGFRDIAAESGSPLVRSVYQANIGASFGRYGSFGAAYIDQRGYELSSDNQPQGSFLLPSSPSFKVATASYSVPLMGGLTFYATGFSNLQQPRSFGLGLGLSIAFGPRQSASTSTNYDSGSHFSGQAQIQQAAVYPGDFGYSVSDQEGERSRRTAQAGYISRWGEVQAGVDQGSGFVAGRAELKGSVAFAGGDTFVSRRVDDSFAVVNSGGVPNVGVLYENQIIGHTDADGQLLVPYLRAWEPNALALDARDLPLDVDAATTRKSVVPRDRSGVAVDFGIKPSNGAVIVLTDEAGHPLPVGLTVELAPGHGTSVIGYDGETYLTGLAAKNVLTVALLDGTTCHAEARFQQEPGELTRIGPLPCLP